MALLTARRGTLTFLLLEDKPSADPIVCPGISVISYFFFFGEDPPCLETFLFYSLLNLMLNEVLIL